MREADLFRINTFPAYVLKTVEANAQGAQERGRDVIRFGMGIPDGATPVSIIDVLADAARNPLNHQYPKANGHPEFLAAIDRYCVANYGFKPSALGKFVTPGGKPAIGHFCYGAFFPGTPVLAPSPYYPIHDMGPKLAQADVITCQVKPGGDHVASIIRAYEKAVRKPRFLLINFPHNPTGECLELDGLKELVKWADHPERDIYILSDEAYNRTVFGQKRAPSILEVDGALKRCMVIFSFSKCLSMSGSRVGFAVGPELMVQALASTDSYLLYGVPSYIQLAAAYGLDHLDQLAPAICATYFRRAHVMAETFTAAGWPLKPTKATMFEWGLLPPAFDHLDSFAFADLLLESIDIAVSPGKGFGEEGEGFARLALNQTEDRIREAGARIKRFLAKGPQ